jgi:HTH-type transcriptional regulator / antitoxin HigA
MREEGKYSFEEIMNNLIKPAEFIHKENLKELFEQRINDLNISFTNALDILKMQTRTLNGILNGTQKTVDFTNLIKIADFLQKPKEQIIKLYIEGLENNFPSKIISSPKKIEFIKENFDLAVLKKANFINNINDFDEIENKIISYFGLNSIFDYHRLPVDVAFSAGLIKPKNELTRSLWIKSANDIFKLINNSYVYDRQVLINYFPQIRWHSINVELGLINIIKELFKIGITVIYQSPLPTLHLRGATFAVNNRPCIVLTDYKGFYPTLWFALIHELFHVIFDWDEILNNSYHLSDENSEQLTVKAKEEEANNFAREYFFSKEKTYKIRPYLSDFDYINEFAINNHVHPSFIYVFNAYDLKENSAWIKARNQNPNIQDLIKPLENPWSNSKPISTFVNSIKTKFYN